MLKAIVMDFDGIIVDTETLWFEIFVDWFEKNKKYHLTIDEFLICVGSNNQDLFTALNHKGIVVDVTDFENDVRNEFITRSAELSLMIGVESFVSQVKNAGLLLAIATSATRPKPLYHLTRHSLIDYFDTLITAECVQNIKPFPDLFNKAAEELNVFPSETLAIEDSQNGLIAANRAGMAALIVPNSVTIHQKFSGNFFTEESLENLTIEYITSKHQLCSSIKGDDYATK